MLTLWQVNDEAASTPFDRRKNVGLHHLALRVVSEEALTKVFERVSSWPGCGDDFAHEVRGAGPKRHTMIYEPGGNRIKFDLDPRK